MSVLSRIPCSSSQLWRKSVISISSENFPYRNYCHSKVLTCLSSKLFAPLQQRHRSTDSETKREAGATQVETTPKSQRARLKQAFRDYGITIVVFHVTISLASLGICYLAIVNGVDAVSLLKSVGFSESFLSSKIAVGGSTFVMAYAVHKLFAPVRMGITLSAVPFLVRYFRKINLIKVPKQK